MQYKVLIFLKIFFHPVQERKADFRALAGMEERNFSYL